MRQLLARIALVLTMTAALSLLVIPVANAYIDPGTGSVIFQALIAGLMAAGFAVKVSWRRLKSLFGFRPSKESPLQEP